MSEAPERIWAVTEPDDISADILGDVYAQQVPDGMVGTPVEYVRADRIEELEAKLAKAVEALGEIDAKVCWEINVSNYDHDQVCSMNDDWSEIGCIATTTLAELTGDKK